MEEITTRFVVHHHGKNKSVELSKIYNKLLKIINLRVYKFNPECNGLSILTNLRIVRAIGGPEKLCLWL